MLATRRFFQISRKGLSSASQVSWKLFTKGLPDSAKKSGGRAIRCIFLAFFRQLQPMKEQSKVYTESSKSYN